MRVRADACDLADRVSPPPTVTGFPSERATRDFMPLNIPGILVPFHLLINPRLVIPALSVRGV